MGYEAGWENYLLEPNHSFARVLNVLKTANLKNVTKEEGSVFPFTLFKIQFESWFSKLYLDILGNGERDLII